MSSGADCFFTETTPGTWVYELQQYPYGANEEYDQYGPFSSFSQAETHLKDFHSNPGGYSTATHEDHVHTYVNKECTGCGGQEPTVMACGCVDYHKATCGSYLMNVGFQISRSRAKMFMDGDEDIILSVAQVSKQQIERALEHTARMS